MVELSVLKVVHGGKKVSFKLKPQGLGWKSVTRCALR